MCVISRKIHINLVVFKSKGPSIVCQIYLTDYWSHQSKFN